MNKLLIFLWIIIISGSIFIAHELSDPESKDISTKTPIETEKLNNNEKNETQDNTYSANLHKGQEAFDELRYDQAINYFQKAADLNPKSIAPLLKLGDAYLKNNDPLNARISYQKAETIEPNSVEIQIKIAQTHLNSRQIEEAKNIILTLDQENELVQYYTAIIEILNKKFEQAHSIFGNLSKSQTTSAQISQNTEIFLQAYKTFSYFDEGERVFLQTLLAKALTDTEQYEAAIPLLFDVINQKNNYKDAWTILGYAYLNTNKTADAIDALNQAQALAPEQPQILYFLGLAYFGNNDLERAIKYLEKADEAGYQPKDQLRLKLGDFYILKKDFEKAGAKFEDVLSLNNNNLDVFVKAVWLNIDKLNDSEKALFIANLALENHPTQAMSYNLVGWALTAEENYNKAEDYLKKSLQINPLLDAAYLNLGWLYQSQNSLELAKTHYKKAYDLGNESSITNLAAARFNKIVEEETKSYQQANISAP